MKLILAIVSKKDVAMVIDVLNDQKFQVTKLATTGGFLKMGNTTLLIGVEDSDVKKVIDIISKYSSKRTQLMPSAVPIQEGSLSSLTFEIMVGGATIFVLNVDRYEKV